ncbi:MAG: protein-L-isoaspartate O-methyltransferase, partial [Gemmatimonadota bacterium]
DVALPLGHGQTISRPGVHAHHLQLAQLEGGERVLEVGTGSGFQTALLSHLAEDVYSIEVVAEIAERAAQSLAQFGAANVALRTGDGSVGWFEHAPYDRILVGAAAPAVPEALVDQLSLRGRMLIPIGDEHGQTLSLVVKHEAGIEITVVDDSRFVPLIGEEGW